MLGLVQSKFNAFTHLNYKLGSINLLFHPKLFEKYNIIAFTLIFIADYKLTDTTSTSIKPSLPIALKSTSTRPLQILHQHHVRTVLGPSCIYTMLTMATNDLSSHLYFHQCYHYLLKCITTNTSPSITSSPMSLTIPPSPSCPALPSNCHHQSTSTMAAATSTFASWQIFI